MTLPAAVALLVAFAAQPGPADDLRIGVAASGEDGICLALPGAAVPIGSPFTLVSVHPPQRVYHATVKSAVPSCAAMKFGIKGPFYIVTTAEPADDLIGDLTVALGGRRPARNAAGHVRLNLNGRYPSVQVRSCASSEGLHLTLWSGTPLRSARLWHFYWYLPYSVEANCRPADYAEKRNDR